VAERANKTIQSLIFKYLTDNQTQKYIDKLPKLVDTYNKRGHRTLEYMSPNEADRINNEARVRDIHMTRFAKIPQKKPTLEINQWVRIKIDSKKIGHTARSYKPQWKPEYYMITRINRLKIPLYHLKAVDDNEVILGGFYKNELVPARGDTFYVEEVLDERGEGRNKQILVKWKNFGPRWNSWIQANQVVQHFRRRGLAGGKVTSVNYPIFGPPGYIKK